MRHANAASLAQVTHTCPRTPSEIAKHFLQLARTFKLRDASECGIVMASACPSWNLAPVAMLQLSPCHHSKNPVTIDRRCCKHRCTSAPQAWISRQRIVTCRATLWQDAAVTNGSTAQRAVLRLGIAALAERYSRNYCRIHNGQHSLGQRIARQMQDSSCGCPIHAKRSAQIFSYFSHCRSD